MDAAIGLKQKTSIIEQLFNKKRETPKPEGINFRSWRVWREYFRRHISYLITSQDIKTKTTATKV